MTALPNVVIVATDFSSSAGRAVKRAAALATQLRVPLRVVHAIGEGDWLRRLSLQLQGEFSLELMRKTAGSRLARLRRRLQKAGVPEVDYEVLDESLPAGLPHLLHDDERGLLVIGARGHNSLREGLLGSTADRVVRAGAMPVLLVRRAPGRPWSRVVLATDLSSASAHAARTALGLCPEAELFLLHAVDVPLDRDFAFASISAQARESFLHETRVQAANRLELFEQALDAQGRPITRAPREGRPQAVLAAFVAEVSADLVVVGARPRARWEANLLGGTAYHAVNRLGCDVLLVPEPGERPLAKEDGWGD